MPLASSTGCRALMSTRRGPLSAIRLCPTNPNGAFLGTGADAVSFVEDGVRHTYVFAGVKAEGLHVNYSDGTNHLWISQGDETDARPSVTTFDDGGRRIHAFVRQFNENRDLWVNYGDGNSWEWANQNEPSGHVTGPPHAITWSVDGLRWIWVFTGINTAAISAPAGLWANVWSGQSWAGFDLSRPSGPQDAVTVSGAATYTLGIERRLVAAVETIDGGDVWITRFKGGTWGWVSLGHP